MKNSSYSNFVSFPRFDPWKWLFHIRISENILAFRKLLIYQLIVVCFFATNLFAIFCDVLDIKITLNWVFLTCNSTVCDRWLEMQLFKIKSKLKVMIFERRSDLLIKTGDKTKNIYFFLNRTMYCNSYKSEPIAQF